MVRRMLGSAVLVALLVVPAAPAAAARARSAAPGAIPLPRDTMTCRARELGRYGGRVVLAATNDPKTLNPLMSNETTSSDVDERLFVGLTEFDNASQTSYPMLARSWQVSRDGLTWTWHLRRGARFSDGHPITSADVLFTFQVLYDPALHPSLQDLVMPGGKPLELSAPDPYTVVTRAAKPFALMVPAVGSVRILPRHVLEPVWRAGRFASAYGVNTPPESLVCSGPWMLRQFVPKEKTVLTRNPYWVGVDAKGRRLPYLDELVWMVVPDPNAAALLFQQPDSPLDGLDQLASDQYRDFARDQAKGGYTLYDLGPGLNSSFFWFNLNTTKRGGDKPPGQPRVDPVKYAWFANRDFRRAVSMAVDRDAIIRSVFFGDAVKNWSLMTSGYRLWHSAATPAWDYDPEGARRLLDSLGFKDRDGDGVREDAQGHPVRFTLKTNAGSVRVTLANFIRDDLAKIGIACTVAPVDFNVLVNNMRQDFQYDAILGGLGAGVPADPGMAANFYLSSGVAHFWNLRQDAPETPEEARLDGLFERSVATNDLAARRRAVEEMDRIVGDQAWLVWLPTPRVKVPVRNRVGNVQPSVVPHRLLWNSDVLFVKTQAPRP